MFQFAQSLSDNTCPGRSEIPDRLAAIMPATGSDASNRATLMSYKLIERFQQSASLRPAALMSSLKSLIPYPAIDEMSLNPSTLILQQQTIFTAFLRCLSFSAANNFAGLDDAALHETFDMFQNDPDSYYLILRQFLPGSAYKALAKKIFEYAIQTGKEQIVDFLLQDRSSDIHTDTPVSLQRSKSYQKLPISFCFICQNIAMTKVLLRHGADAKMKFSKFDAHVSRLNPELISVLSDAGAIFEDDVLQNLAAYGNLEVVRRIILKRAHHYSRESNGQLFCEFMYNVDRTLTMDIVNIMIDIGYDISIAWPQRQSVLHTASRRGCLDVVRKLVQFNALLPPNILTPAVESENLELVQFLLGRGANVNTAAFAAAVRLGNAEIGRLLVQAGALRFIKCRSSHDSPLAKVMDAAVAAGHTGVSQAVQSIAENIRDEWPFDDVLHKAIVDDQTGVALNLIRHGIPVTQEHLDSALVRKNVCVARAILDVDDIGLLYDETEYFLVMATELGDLPLTAALIAAGAGYYLSWNEDYACGFCNRREANRDSPLFNAVKNGDTEMIKLLLHSGADVNFKERSAAKPGEKITLRTPLEAAVDSGDIRMVKFLFEQGADPNDSGALARAENDDDEIVHLLLEEFGKRYPDGKKFYGSQALKAAIEHGKLSMIKTIWQRADTTALTSSGEERQPKWTSPLASAIIKNQGTGLIEAQTLLRLGADPNRIAAADINTRSSPNHLTALEVAIGTGSLPIVQVLLQNGANVNSPATKGFTRTPLQKAAELGTYDIVQLLLDCGADVNAAAAKVGGGTALQLASIKGYAGIAVLLLKSGANIDAPPAMCSGRTSLEGAAEWGRIDMVKLLLEAGVEIEGQGERYFQHAIRLAKKNKHDTTVEVLQSYQRPKIEPVRPKALFPDCEGWTVWVIETDEGFEPWQEPQIDDSSQSEAPTDGVTNSEIWLNWP